MAECTQCPHTVGDSYQRDCCFPDCVGGWEEAYKNISAKAGVLEIGHFTVWKDGERVNIVKDDGEGGGFDADVFEKVITDFYDNHF
jgi:hypothetical protein